MLVSAQMVAQCLASFAGLRDVLAMANEHNQ